MTPAERNRADFPTVAKVLDDCRRVFGADTKLRHAVENGKEIGRPIEGAVPLVMTPTGWSK